VQDKMLWMLEYPQGKGVLLVPLYAVSEEDAQHKAALWAELKRVELPSPLILHPYPHGFMGGAYEDRLPGKLLEKE